MGSLLTGDLSRELQCLQQEAEVRSSATGHVDPVARASPEGLVEKACDVVHLLTGRPYLSAKAVSESCGLSKPELELIYEMIWRSDACQWHFRASKSRDYFSVVNHYFAHRMFTLVFFVGNSCPSRCIYCPNVKIDERGRRQITTYESDGDSSLTSDVVAETFGDLDRMREGGTDLLVKISGGLEPLTDMATVSTIIQHARAKGIRLKLFTNGLLFSEPSIRTTILGTTDIRISLSTPDEEEYQKICFADHEGGTSRALANLKDNITKLVEERNRNRLRCKIGFNSIILPSNHTRIVQLIEMARELKMDYVDLKPDYFSSYRPEVIEQMEESTRRAQECLVQNPIPDLRVNFACSLFREDLYWDDWDRLCDAAKQSRFKLFITPFGECSPVHHGAFPQLTGTSSANGDSAAFTIGKLGAEKGLSAILDEPSEIPKIEMKRLNPFELMLNLEIEREEEDAAWGLPQRLGPYRPSTLHPSLPCPRG